MYCKKCGTERKDGHKFCPKCGEPYFDENGQPYLKGFRKDIKDAKDRMTSKVDELTQQGKKLVEEKVQPQFNEKIEEFRKTDWNEKKHEAISYVKGLYGKFGNVTIKAKTIVIVGVVLLLIILFGKLNCSNTESSLFQGESLQEEFIGLLDDPSTAFTVRIDKKLMRTEAGAMWVQVPEGEGSRDGSYIWTLIFFPDESKTSGRAVLEPWLIDEKAWARGFTKSYQYEVRDDRLELYNGWSSSGSHWNRDLEGTRADDIRLNIEKDAGIIILRGEFARKERLFKQTQYIAASEKEKHYM